MAPKGRGVKQRLGIDVSEDPLPERSRSRVRKRHVQSRRWTN